MKWEIKRNGCELNILSKNDIDWSSRESLLSITLLFLQFHPILSVIKLFSNMQSHSCSLALPFSSFHKHVNWINAVVYFFYFSISCSLFYFTYLSTWEILLVLRSSPRVIIFKSRIEVNDTACVFMRYMTPCFSRRPLLLFGSDGHLSSVPDGNI